MKKSLILALCALLTTITGCDGCQPLARSLGGSATIRLPPGKHLEMATWKGDAVWYIVRDRRPDEKPERHELRESDPYGLPEGVVYLIEQ